MFQKIIGIIGAVSVVGAIVMVAVSPRTDGFFPNMFERTKRPRASEPVEPSFGQPEPYLDSMPAADTLPILPDRPSEQTGQVSINL